MNNDLLSQIKRRIKLKKNIIQDRWESGTPHHPLSELLIEAMRAIDYKFFDISLDIDMGGDGDNGESMMYVLDAYFEELDGINDILKVINSNEK